MVDDLVEVRFRHSQALCGSLNLNLIRVETELLMQLAAEPDAIEVGPPVVRILVKSNRLHARA